MQEFEAIDCDHDGFALAGLVARPDGRGPFPTVIVMHSASRRRAYGQRTAPRRRAYAGLSSSVRATGG